MRRIADPRPARLLTFTAALLLLLVAACAGGPAPTQSPLPTDAVTALPTATPGDTHTPGATLPEPEVVGADVVDPLAGAEEPGVVSCDGCAAVAGVGEAVDVAGAADHTFSGRVAGGDGDGSIYLRAADGQALRAPVAVGLGGAFSVRLPLFCGEQTAKLAFPNGSGTGGAVQRVTGGACPAPGLRVSMTWSGSGEGLELHLVRQGGLINDRLDGPAISNDCLSATCRSTSPDWGAVGEPADDPAMDLYRTGARGPDSLGIDRPAEGRYLVLVENRSGSDLELGTGEVTVNVSGAATVSIPFTLHERAVVLLAAIDLPGATVLPLGTVFDCREAWGREGGCGAGIP